MRPEGEHVYWIGRRLIEEFLEFLEFVERSVPKSSSELLGQLLGQCAHQKGTAR